MCIINISTCDSLRKKNSPIYFLSSKILARKLNEYPFFLFIIGGWWTKIDSYMSEIKQLTNLLLKEFNLISYVQELSESQHNQPELFTPRLVD